MKPSLNQSSHYRSFTRARDQALEQIHNNAQLDISRILNQALVQATEIVSTYYAHIPEQSHFLAVSKNVLKMIEHRLDQVFAAASHGITERIMRMRRNVYLLTAAAESEAIGQSIGQKTKVSIARHDLDHVMLSKTGNDENLLSRVDLTLMKLKRKILDAVETSRVMEESTADAIKRVKATFPKVMAYKRPPKVLKPVREAKKTQPEFMSNPLVDDNEWDDMIDSYKKTELPDTRFINEPLDIDTGDPELEERYAWDIEQELAHDFVTKVRQGQEEAANQAGIQDFVWISVIDDKTDECCVWRDGLLTSEIEQKLESGDDDCNAVVPPAHFNCRCRIAPVGETPDRIESNLGDFEEWLNS